MNEYILFKSNCSGGLNHQTSNIYMCILYSYHYKCKLILPTLTLAAKHNNNKILYSQLDKYYDY